MKQFLKRLFARKSVRPAVPRPAAIRLQLEALETRLTPSATAVQTAVLKTNGELDLYNTQTGTFQLLSPAGTISTISAAQTASGDTVVFAVPQGTDASGNLHTLWEYDAAAGSWSEISTGYFQQISAATNAAGGAVVFGVLGQGGAQPNYANSLWEYSNGVWLERSAVGLQPLVIIAGQSDPYPPGSVLSVSAVGTAQGEVAFAIGSDQHLYEYAASGGWTQISTGSFQQVSAGLDANGQADAFAVLGQGTFTGYVGSLWQYDNSAWTELAGPDILRIMPFVVVQGGQSSPLPPSQYMSVAAGVDGEVFGVAGDHTLWLAGAELELSSGSFAQVSATQTSAGADVVFGTLTDGSLWEYTGGGWAELLTGGVAATATPL